MKRTYAILKMERRTDKEIYVRKKKVCNSYFAMITPCRMVNLQNFAKFFKKNPLAHTACTQRHPEIINGREVTKYHVLMKELFGSKHYQYCVHTGCVQVTVQTTVRG